MTRKLFIASSLFVLVLLAGIISTSAGFAQESKPSGIHAKDGDAASPLAPGTGFALVYQPGGNPAVSVASNIYNNGSSGRVGIGTTNPSALLDVGTGPWGGDIYLGRDYPGASGLYKTFSTAHSDGNVPSALKIGILDGAYAGITINNVRDGLYNSQYLSFDTHHGGASAGTRMTINKKGNVGIGTTNPNSTLQVVGYIQLDLTSGSPPAADCDEGSELGRMKVDNVSELLYICVDTGWIAK